MGSYELTDQQRQFFKDFGFLKVKGGITNDLGWIEEEFEGVFTDRGVTAETGPKQIVPFIDQRERFCALIDHPTVDGIATGILGADWNYNGGDGNLYQGDTPWHRDGDWKHATFIKIAIYLDPVGPETGALRVIPGTFRLDWLPPGFDPVAYYGVEGKDIPAVALDSEPGDLVVFNHNMYHAAFGGSSRRRMFTMNLNSHAGTPEQLAEIKRSIAAHAGYGIDKMHSEIMRSTASPARMRHLRQIIENEGHLPELSAQVREKASAGAS